jgi:hypothetical protein
MAAKKRNRKLSPANLEIMKVVWEKGDVTINDVVEAINANRKNRKPEGRSLKISKTGCLAAPVQNLSNA